MPKPSTAQRGKPTVSPSKRAELTALCAHLDGMPRGEIRWPDYDDGDKGIVDDTVRNAPQGK